MKIEYHKELEKILEIVKKNPKGSTIKEISEKIGVNRNAVAKYLDVL
ncbi:MAG TPA: winged helix-turn-helix transcriptional regulator, partial [Thermoplasmatales archaeon]|nr:winged helix-turn-helix transcriptional regulator [Thermoplasmatales archaeon]